MKLGSFMAKKCTKKCDAHTNFFVLLIVNLFLNFFTVFVALAVVVSKAPSIVVIQKFCYHGDMTSHFSSLF